MIDNSPVSLWLPAVKLLSQCVVPTSRLDIFHSEFRPNPVSHNSKRLVSLRKLLCYLQMRNVTLLRMTVPKQSSRRRSSSQHTLFELSTALGIEPVEGWPGARGMWRLLLTNKEWNPDEGNSKDSSRSGIRCLSHKQYWRGSACRVWKCLSVLTPFTRHSSAI